MSYTPFVVDTLKIKMFITKGVFFEKMKEKLNVQI